MQNTNKQISVPAKKNKIPLIKSRELNLFIMLFLLSLALFSYANVSFAQIDARGLGIVHAPGAPGSLPSTGNSSGRQAEAHERARIERERSNAIKAEFAAYSARQKTLLEEVLNYTTTSDESGNLWNYWISGLNGDHKCVLTERNAFFERKIDLRQINPDGFRIVIDRSRQVTAVRDEKWFLGASSSSVFERLEKAWELAFSECPSVVRRRF